MGHSQRRGGHIFLHVGSLKGRVDGCKNVTMQAAK